MKMEVLMRGQALLAAGAMAMTAVTLAPLPAAAQPSQYQSYSNQDPTCTKARQDRMVAGGALGAIAGAILGSNVAGHGAKSEGGVLGAVAGAVAGGAIGRSTAKCGPYNSSYNGPYNGQYNQGPYSNNDPRYDDYGLEGGSYRQSSYGGDNGYQTRDCRYGEQVLRDPDGRAYRQNVMMCRGRDGVWRPE
jgi:hypothetical protein